MSELDAVLARADADLDAALDRLFATLRLKSISTDPAYAAETRACAEWHAADLASIGFDASVRDTAGHPMVVAHDRSAPGTSVLFYGHYDVQPVDPLEWGMTPQTVNAYYNPPRNEIVFPAAILQAPFFDPNADPAVNYGGIGAVIGHEITHGFDDQGRKTDANGVLRDWWTPEDAARFEERAKTLGAIYAAEEPVPGTHINGDLTMGENIADLGGLLMALDAYKRSLNGQPAPVIDGLTGEQRVFLGWAQVWREKSREEALKEQLTTDPHSPGMARAATPPRNIDAWYAAFGVTPDQAEYIAPEKRARIW